MRMELGRMDLVAPYLEKSVWIHAIRVVRGRKGLVIADHVERLFRIGTAADHVIYMALIHRHNGLRSMESAHMPIGRLMDILHSGTVQLYHRCFGYSKIPSRLTS